MATSDLAPPRGLLQSADSRSQATATQLTLGRVLAFLASLRLTVVLFALSIILIFIGTLAQKDQDVWRVVNDTYFRVWFARVDFQIFERLAQLFFKSVNWNLQGGFYFFGGKTLGLALLMNLAAAHSIRFRIAAEGKRLYAGLATIAVGALTTYLVIHAGMNKELESELSPAFCDILWQCFRGLLAVLTLAGAYVLIFWNAPAKHKLIEWWVLLVVDVLLAVLTVWLLAHPEARVDNSGIRILWQLAKGSASAAILLVGCVLVFRKRAGIVLLHSGIALIMLTELFTAVAAVESQMVINEGGSASYSDDIRTNELAVIDRSPSDHDQITVVPKSLLVENVGGSEPIDHVDLPFTIRVLRWVQNSKLRNPAVGDSNPATAGFGKETMVDEVPAATGVGESAEKTDLSSAYIELTSKKTGKSLGTFLVSQTLREQPIEVDGHTYDLALRFKRLYHPFTIALKDFRFDRYAGTNTAKNYSSEVTFKDPTHNIEHDAIISMNNPLRYGGTTLYQSSFDDKTEQATVLQVVRNPSWMTPYVACMMVGMGMFAHFGIMLYRYLLRRAEDAEEFESSYSGGDLTARQQKRIRRQREFTYTAPSGRWATFGKWFPAIVLIVFAGYVGSKARLPHSQPGEMQIDQFAKLPVVYEGRVKPYDTLARNSLQILSSRQEVSVIDDQGKVTSKVPAIRWLLDAISNAKGAGDHCIFRVENLELVDALGLPHRPMFWRYSLNEITNKKATVPDVPEITTELGRQVMLARKTSENERSLIQSKVIDLQQKFDFYTLLVISFRTPPENADPQALVAVLQDLLRGNPPFSVPPLTADGQWSPLFQAEIELQYRNELKRPLNPATAALASLLKAYERNDVTTFNKQLADYRALLKNYERSVQSSASQLKLAGVAKSEMYSQSKSDFEVFFNQFSPFYYASVLYVMAFVLGVFSWIGWTQPLRRASIWLLWFTFALHTFALIARVYISGRPPITNLYSTAIFIGWAVVLLSLVLESIQKLGLANIVASVVGFITLFLAYNLSLDGDTFIVLQAVLDTQFWLATHVISMNLGYAATYAAGAWGIVYIFCTHVFHVLDDEARKKVLRTLYGTLCFAIFFSFIGTVLGGLWADDSWGRFWGWDPKENGALMIVLWNALVLHARWGALVKGRGLATLSVFGNIITTWSYFGVNEYGVGLHAYGASESKTAVWLLAFGTTQLAIIALGLMPPRWFERLRPRAAAA
jgi:ABC-type transport system involved in cytochrome c biogenesis permease subunit